MSGNITELEAKVERLRAELNAAENELESSLIAASGLAVGDIVIGTGRHLGKIMRVTRVRTWGHDKPWVSGNIERKDGSFGMAERNFYDNWEKPAPLPGSEG